ncbi:MAG: hypothetical protein ACLGIS_19080, partial [Actinomycetes bacterium]
PVPMGGPGNIGVKPGGKTPWRRCRHPSGGRLRRPFIGMFMMLLNGALLRLSGCEGLRVPCADLAHESANTGREAHQGGSGLGLAISKAQGGALEVTIPGPEHGAGFCIRLPQYQPEN